MGDLHADAASVEVRGSELVVSTEGRVLARPELIGAVLALVHEDGGVADVRIDRIVTDPGRVEGDVVHYDLSVADDSGAWVPACPTEPDGMPHAVLQSRPGGAIGIVCTAGARGKCIRLGYRPWAERDGVSLAEVGPRPETAGGTRRALEQCRLTPRPRRGRVLPPWARRPSPCASFAL